MYILLQKDVHRFLKRCTSIYNGMYISLRIDVHLFRKETPANFTYTSVWPDISYQGKETD